MIPLYPISENLKHLIHLYNISESELSRQLDLPRQTINRITTGSVSNPTSTTLMKIAYFFDISVDELLGNAPIKINKKVSTIYSVPIIKKEELSLESILTMQTIHSNDDYMNIDILPDNDQDVLFAIDLEGMAMFPKFEEGTILIFKRSHEFKNKGFVLIYVTELNSILFRQITAENNYYTINPINISYPSIVITDNDIVIGNLIRSIRKF